MNTVETPTIGPCAMSWEIPYSGKGAKNSAKGELLSPSKRHRKIKKHQTLPEEEPQRHSTRADWWSFYGSFQDCADEWLDRNNFCANPWYGTQHIKPRTALGILAPRIHFLALTDEDCSPDHLTPMLSNPPTEPHYTIAKIRVTPMTHTNQNSQKRDLS